MKKDIWIAEEEPVNPPKESFTRVIFWRVLVVVLVYFLVLNLSSCLTLPELSQLLANSAACFTLYFGFRSAMI